MNKSMTEVAIHIPRAVSTWLLLGLSAFSFSQSGGG